MASPISRRPAGLLDLLLSQQQGQNPTKLEDDVQPIIDMSQFYEADRISIDALTTNLSAVGVTATHTVPAGEHWKLIAVGFAGVFNAANQRVQIYFSFSGFSGTALGYSIGWDAKTAAAASDVYADGLYFPQPLIVPSGTELKFSCGSLDLQASTTSLLSRVIYVRMES